MRPDQIWQAVLSELSVQINPNTFALWLRDTVLLSSDEEVFVVGVESEAAIDWLEARLLGTLQRTLAAITGKPVTVRFETYGEDSLPSSAEPVTPEPVEPWKPDWRDLGVPHIFESETLGTLDWSVPALQKTELADYADHALHYLQAGLGLTLIGPAGVGKTHVAVGLLKLAVEAGWTATFVDVGDLADRVLSAENPSQRRGRLVFMDRLLTELIETELLVLDDLNANTLELSVNRLVAKVIKRRWKRKAPIIVTTNCLLGELAYPVASSVAGLEDSVTSRLVGATIVLTLIGHDHRLICKRQRLTQIRSLSFGNGATLYD